ncbi:FUSC family protein [Novacetimonas pomaceti]|uniref:FUSC family protein n=1 Tax=Novacetimonas pomaceti TaxID=2021998 RepID=A0A318QFS9_9PROT|nr:FUSC family protein [Novacetimonas pomaceti]MBV1833865.1 FUSC family protein [Novacetimonas pomaceti]PYD46977.1 FUSC family protein [Novacetimonas pomaceti]PYD76198.1 FUSC family protein [Novacetimonas pomaceti]
MAGLSFLSLKDSFLLAGGTWRQVVRMLVSLIGSGVVAHLVHLQEPVWALITSVVVITQSRMTQTLSTGQDQVVGTLIGASAGISAIAMEQWLYWPTDVVFWVMLMPVAVLAAARPKMRVAVITLMVVLLFPGNGAPFARPFDRIASIMIGVVVSFVVSFFVLRNGARREVLRNSAVLLRRLSDLLQLALHQHPDNDAVSAIDDACRALLQDLNDGVKEAEVEHPGSLARHDPLVLRLPGLLRRLRADAIFIARAAVEGEAASTGHPLRSEREVLQHVLGLIADRCDQAASRSRRHPLPDDGVEDVLAQLPQPGTHWTPVMHFALGLLHTDLTVVIRNVWADGRTDEGASSLGEAHATVPTST